MDVADLKRDLAEYQRQLQDAEAKLRRAASERDAVRLIVSGLSAYIKALERGQPATTPLFDLEPQLGEDGEASGPPTPRGRQAVLRILEALDREAHIDEIVAEAKDRGWMTDVANPRNALNAAAKRLVSDGKIRHAGVSTYAPLADVPPEGDVAPATERGGESG